MEDEQTLQNPFPSPPSLYVNYTQHNLHLLSLFRTRLEAGGEPIVELDEADIVKKQHELLANENDIPDWPLTQLEKPRADWIVEDGYYNVYGDSWFTKEAFPSLKDMGAIQLYPENPTVDRRPALKSVLTTMLFTYSSFLSSIVAPPPSYVSDIPPDWDRLLEWMRVMGQNLIAAANDLRPIQARANLEGLMNRQLELRQEETKAIHAKCDELESKINEVLQRVNNTLYATRTSTSEGKLDSSADSSIDMLFDEPITQEDADKMMVSTPQFQEITEEDLRKWAEGNVGG